MRSIFIILFLYCLLASCYKPYDPGIVATDTILVVDGMITNEVASYYIRLSYALPFDSKITFKPLFSAMVSVNDDLGNHFPFNEVNNGNYKSDSLQFTGQPGRIYTLHIETSDGEIYASSPQRLYPESCPDSIYAETYYQETISRFNQLIVTAGGANIMLDIKSKTDTLPHFRFNSDLGKQYFYEIYVPPPVNRTYYFYCWKTVTAISDINLTKREYSLNFTSINKHAVYFVDDKIDVLGIVYRLFPRKPGFPYIALPTEDQEYYPLNHRILYLNQYSLNNETYLYYKSMDELLRSEGKLFDPIAAQLRGNIKCTTNPDKIVFGFFEASSVSHTAYSIGPRKPDNQYSIRKEPYKLPSEPNGCWIDTIPPFWINY